MASDKITELKALQSRLNLGGVHLVWLGQHSFAIAHTDEERATGDLGDCELHEWLTDCYKPPFDPGYYIVTPHELDSFNEPVFTELDMDDYQPPVIDNPHAR